MVAAGPAGALVGPDPTACALREGELVGDLGMHATADAPAAAPAAVVSLIRSPVSHRHQQEELWPSSLPSVK
jgi:hypothetical protein